MREIEVICKEYDEYVRPYIFIQKCLVDDEDYEMLNKYAWRSKLRWWRNEGKMHYPRIKIKNKHIRMHQILCPCDAPLTVDHRNGNTMDNRKANLRIATQSQQCANRKRILKGKYSKFRGVTKSRSKSKPWLAKTKVNNKKIIIGRFDDEIEAAKAYDTFAKDTWGEFATLNFPDMLSI